jgi:signal transduction histidine kinase
MVEETLQFAAVQAGRKRYELVPVDVQEAVRRALAGMAPAIRESGFEVRERIEPALPPVRADSGALSQCLQNLLANALKYGGERSWVEVRAGRDAGDPRIVAIAVADSGPGIPAEEMPRIFEPFYQGSAAPGAKSRGVGLGLYLTRRIVEAMEGSIHVDAGAGRGSVFTLRLRSAGAPSRTRGAA